MSYRVGAFTGPKIVCDFSDCLATLQVVGRGQGGKPPAWLHRGSPPGWKTIRDIGSRRDYCPQHNPENRGER
jgi:hypothetical protein